MAKTTAYLVAGCKPWNRRTFEVALEPQPGQWHFVDSRSELESILERGLSPRYIFFLHWSWIVPDEICEAFECVCFHMTDVPFGRGGSPLQNLITRGHKKTVLTALRMTRGLDAGPVYMKEPLSIEGGAEEIYIRADELASQMVAQIVEKEPTPQPQAGPTTLFNRRRPEQSEIFEAGSISELFDHIRMLDAEGYPKAFVRHGGFTYRFTRAALYDGRIEADVVITKDPEGKA